MKAHIIGISGSGKTTLARWLGETFAATVFDLDRVVYDRAAGERSSEEIVRRLGEIRAGKSWVTEGAYRDGWLAACLTTPTSSSGSTFRSPSAQRG